jgi:hypothetical protein
MSDIFISYAKADHALALKLSAFLEAEGWSVWWDKSLGAADLYRDEIMKQLTAARTVITIWTENSVKSDWVRAEAGRAKAEGKLIPVKTSDLAYSDIPLPFGEMHTENVASTELIRAAVVARLTPAVPLTNPAVPMVSRSWSRHFKYQVLTWIGIVGGAITLFASLSTILNLADWARALIEQWQALNQMFWGLVFGLINVKISEEVVPVISITALVVLLGVGVIVSERTRQRVVKFQSAAKLVRTVHGILYVAAGVLPFVLAYELFIVVLSFGMEREATKVSTPIPLIFTSIWTIFVPIVYFSLVKQRSAAFTDLRLFCAMGICVFFVIFMNISVDLSSVAIIFMWFILFQMCWMAVILFSPLPQLTRRLGFVVLGVLILIGLSEISKLNLHQYLQPPKVSENSVR